MTPVCTRVTQVGNAWTSAKRKFFGRFGIHWALMEDLLHQFAKMDVGDTCEIVALVSDEYVSIELVAE